MLQSKFAFALAVPRARRLGRAAARAPTSVRAQDTTHAVRIGLTYQPGTKPGVIVLAVPGAWGDSIQGIVARDLDYGDRVNVIGLPGTPAAGSLQSLGPSVSYPLWKSLGAAAVVQATVTNGGVHVAVHDVTGAKIVQVADFPLPPTGGSGDWRLAVHGVADAVEQWITGTHGVAQTRMLFVRGGRVYVVDSDGWGERQVTDAGLALSPAWSPDGHTIAYSVLGSRGLEHRHEGRERRRGAHPSIDHDWTQHDTGVLAQRQLARVFAWRRGGHRPDARRSRGRRAHADHGGSRLGQHVAGVQPRRSTNRVHIGSRGASGGIHYGCRRLERGAAHSI